MALASLPFFLFPVWAALSAAAHGQAGRESCPPVLCGNVSISFTFRILEQQGTECGLFGFQVLCSNNTPYLGYYQGRFWFQILDIFYGNGSLIIADVHKLKDFSIVRGCHAPTNNSSNKLGYPFSTSPANKNLIFYNCAKAPAMAERGVLVGMMCHNHNNTFVRVAERFDESGSYGAYALDGCNATVVPVLGLSGKFNASRYEELVSDGFLLTWELLRKPGKGSKRHRIGIVFGVVGAGILVLVVCFLFFVWHKCKRRKQGRASSDLMRSGSSLQSYSKDLELGGSLHIFTYEELEEATEGFSATGELGDGGFGTVYKGNSGMGE